MNKENIEKKKRMLKDFSEKGQGQRVFFEEDLELIRDILQHLEQKESILDKVTDKLKKMKQTINKLENRDGESMLMVDICIQNIITFYRDIENIIEGEKK